MSRPSPSSSSKELLYRRGEYLAVRAGDDDFYLCQALQHVYTTTKRFKIMWLSELAKQVDTYYLDYIDNTDFACIITHIRLSKVAKDTYRLPENQKEKIVKELQELLNPEETDEEEEEETEDERDEESDEDEPKAKRARKTPAKTAKKASAKPRAKPQTKKTATVKSGKVKRGAKKAAVTKTKKRAAKKTPKVKKEKKSKEGKHERGKKRRLTPEERANPNLLLVPKPNLRIWDKNPLTLSNEKVPYVSSTAHSKLVFRAVAMNDMKLLQSLIDNTKTIDKVDYQYSVDVSETPIHHAVRAHNTKAIQLLVKEVFDRDEKKPARCSAARNLMKTTGTGRYDRRSLYIPAVRTLSMSRGSKEGNNALTKDESASYNREDIAAYVNYAMSCGVPQKTIDTLLISSNNESNHYFVDDAIVHAIRNGHRKLAAAFLVQREQRRDNSFNVLAREVLQFDTEDLRKSSLREASIKKKSWDNANITPLHCAAINPNTKYLQRLCSVLPEYGIQDRNNRRPVHYAAACEGTGPLEYLMNRGVDTDEPDSTGTTPLMIACETGRVHNVDFLLRQAKAKAEMTKEEEEEEARDEDEEESVASPVLDKYGIGGINRPIQRPNKYHSYCPIHLAIAKNQADVVKCLIKYGVDVNKRLGPKKNKVTPLMLACGLGNMAIVKALVKENARVEEKDKLQRSPLIHAVLNGQAHIASYLLSLGADPNQADSSGNSCLHYASAYGWYFCVKTLLKAGADPSKSNDWQVSPLGVAFLKGHMGVVDILLQQPGIDINFKDDQGKTLVALACSSELVEGVAGEVEYLVRKKGADVTISDVNKNTPLHHLARNEITNNRFFPKEREHLKQCMQIAKILLENGATGSEKNEEGATPVMYAIEQGNVELTRLLIDKGGEFSVITNEKGQNMLHLAAQKCMASDLTPLLEVVKKAMKEKKSGGNLLQEMAQVVDDKGYTPLLYACKAYREWRGGSTKDSDQTGIDDDDDEEEEEEEEEESEHDSDDSDYDSNSGSFKRKAAKPSKRPAKVARKDETSTSDKVDPTWGYGRQFISCLCSLCSANLSATVQEKKLTPDEAPRKRAERYEHPKEAKFSAFHYLVEANHEPPVKTKKGDIESYCPVLSLLLESSPSPALDSYDLSGRTPLIMAVQEATLRKQDCAKKLVEHGASVNLMSKVKSQCDSTPLSIALSNGCSLDVIEALLKGDINTPCTKHKNTPLHMAVSKNRSREDVLQVVEKLVQCGANINAANYKGHTPLHYAVDANRGDSDATSELESYLIENGADVLAKDHRGRLALHYAFTKIEKYQDTSHIDPIELCTTLTGHMAAHMIDTADNRGQTPLHLAARRGAGVCCTVLAQKRCNINARDKTGNTPLTLAAITGHENCAIMLIQRNAAINTTAVIVPPPQPRTDAKKPKGSENEEYEDGSDEEEEEEASEKKDEELSDSEDEGETSKPNPWVCKVYRQKPREPLRVPLFQVCVKNNWPGVIYMMLEAMEEANLTFTSTIEAALNIGQYNLALTLIRKFKDARKFRETSQVTGRSLLHTLAAKVRSDVQHDLILRVAQELVNRGTPVDTKDHYGCKPLHYAALRHNVHLIRFIQTNVTDLDVNESDRFGRTPLAAAFWTLKPESLTVYEELYTLGANLNDQYSFPEVTLHFGKMPADTRTADQVEAEYVTEQKSVRCTPLIRAIQMQDFEMVKRLLRDGADPNTRDALQQVPLVHAIRKNNIHLVKLLLNHSYNMPGKDVTEVEWIAYNDEGSTAQRANQSASRVFSLFGTRNVADSDDEDGGGGGDDGAKKGKDAGTKKDASCDIDLSAYKAFRNVSGVKLTLVDQQGWSLLHHVVMPVDEATYDNAEMLKLLSDAGAPLAMKDLKGLTPLDYALSHNAPDLAKALQKLMGVSRGHWEKPTTPPQPPVSDGLTWTTPTPNFNSDSAALVRKFEEEWMDEDQPDDRPKPDKKLEMDESGEVEMDVEQSLAYDVVLTKVSVEGNSGWGVFNFYNMQVVKHKAKDLWVLFNRWGYIGEEGQYQRTPFGKREEAVKEFCKIFKAKTGNDWKNVKSFEGKPKKYRVVDPEDRRKRKSLRDIKLNLKSKVPSSLPDSLHDLMKELMNVQMLQSAYSNSQVDQGIIPFSRMRKETIAKAVELLNTLRPIVEDMQEMKRKNLFAEDNLEVYKGKYKEVVLLSNQIYQLLPDRGYAFQSITVLHTPELVEQFTERLVNLAELELASRITAGAMYSSKEVNPTEYVYRSIGATLRAMDPDEIEAQYLLKYLTTGMGSAGRSKRIEAIFEVERPGEHQRINSLPLENHKLLLHGTRPSNLISILHRGLLIAPPGALITGHLHGKGIYFADMFDKSVSYSSGSGYRGANKYKYMLVCEVALGNMQVTSYEEDLKGFDSRHIPGSRAPHSTLDVKLRDGCTLPLGDAVERKVKDNSYLPHYSEYIIFRADQVRIRYLVKFS